MKDQRGISVKPGDRVLFGANICTVVSIHEPSSLPHIGAVGPMRLELQPDPIHVEIPAQAYNPEAGFGGMFVLPADPEKAETRADAERASRLRRM